MLRASLAALVCIAPSLGAQLTVRRPAAPIVNQAVIAEDKADSLAVAAPLILSSTALGEKLTELGLRPNSIMEGETVKLTVVSPRHTVGNLGLVDVATTSVLSGDGWAAVRGSAIARFTAQAGTSYLVDFSVGDLPGASTAGTRKFTARIYNGAMPAGMQVQEFTVPKGSQHVVMVVEAKGRHPSVVLTLNNQPSGMMSQLGSGLSTSTGNTSGPQFIFYSAEISRLK